jgi:hypothetical protein
MSRTQHWAPSRDWHQRDVDRAQDAHRREGLRVAREVHPVLRFDDEAHAATPWTKWRTQAEVDRAGRQQLHSIDFQPIAGQHFLCVLEPSPSQQRLTVARRQDSRLLSEELQGWQVEVVMMEMRDQHGIDVAGWRIEHVRVPMDQAIDSRP